MNIDHEQSLSSTDLSVSEAGGGVAASYFQGRRHALPHSWPSPILRFLADPASVSSPNRRPSSSAPRPSASSRPRPTLRQRRSQGGDSTAATAA
jgi:hypothetical protein